MSPAFNSRFKRSKYLRLRYPQKHYRYETDFNESDICNIKSVFVLCQIERLQKELKEAKSKLAQAELKNDNFNKKMDALNDENKKLRYCDMNWNSKYRRYV